MSLFNSVVDRALSEHDGSMLCNKKSNGKYSSFLPVTNLGAVGSAPESIDKTVIGNMAKTYIQGRKDTPAQTLTFFAHRDNINVLEGVARVPQDFLRVFPDMSAMKYSGLVDYSISDVAVGSAEQGEVTITVTSVPEYVDNAFSLIEDTVVFTGTIADRVVLAEDASNVISITTDPATATVTAESDTAGVATATYSNGSLTIEGVATGSAIVTITATATGYNGFTRTIFVNVIE